MILPLKLLSIRVHLLLFNIIFQFGISVKSINIYELFYFEFLCPLASLIEFPHHQSHFKNHLSILLLIYRSSLVFPVPFLKSFRTAPLLWDWRREDMYRASHPPDNKDGNIYIALNSIVYRKIYIAVSINIS